MVSSIPVRVSGRRRGDAALRSQPRRRGLDSTHSPGPSTCAYTLTAAYNAKVGLAILCPIASQVKGYPFEVHVRGERVEGVVLSDQVKSLD
jgi:hypothetical protein